MNSTANNLFILTNASLAATAAVGVVWSWHGPTPAEQLALLIGLAISAPLVLFAVEWCARSNGWPQRRAFRHVFGLRPLFNYPSGVGMSLRLLFGSAQVLFVVAGLFTLGQ